MLLKDWADGLTQSFQNLSYGLVQFIPSLVVAIVIFIIGWLIGVGVGRIVMQIVNSLRVDQALRSAGVDDVLKRAGFELNSGAFLGGLVKWFFIVVFLVASLNILGLAQVNGFLITVVLAYLPHVIAAALIILVAAVIADASERVISGAAKAAHIHSANLAGTVTRWAIWVFAILAALSQLGIATEYFQTLFMGIIVTLSLAIGLAFGLGGQQAAARYLDHLRDDIKE